MKNKDILKEIYSQRITEKEAQSLFDKIIDEGLGSPSELMMLNLRKEYTAILLHDMPFTTVARWRYEGWPSKCAICGKDLNLEQGNWRAFHEIMINGVMQRDVMTHWNCYEKLEGRI